MHKLIFELTEIEVKIVGKSLLSFYNNVDNTIITGMEEWHGGVKKRLSKEEVEKYERFKLEILPVLRKFQI